MLKGKRFFFLILFISGVFLISKILIEKFLMNFPYFKIEEVVTEDKRLNLDYLKGNSIFKINLRKISEELSSNYPEFKEIILNFQFPYRLNAQVKEHTPLAKLILKREFFTDEEGRIFLGGRNLDLPEITGLEKRIIRPEIYKKYQIPELFLSLNLLKISPYKIKRIDASKKEELAFFLHNGLKIKIGNRDYSERLKRLSLLLKELKEVKDVDYIDLRFSDPIIKFKDER